MPVIYSELLCNNSSSDPCTVCFQACVSTKIGYNDACNQFPQEGKKSTYPPSSRFPRVGFRSVVILALYMLVTGVNLANSRAHIYNYNETEKGQKSQERVMWSTIVAPIFYSPHSDLHKQ